MGSTDVDGRRVEDCAQKRLDFANFGLFSVSASRCRCLPSSTTLTAALSMSTLVYCVALIVLQSTQRFSLGFNSAKNITSYSGTKLCSHDAIHFCVMYSNNKLNFIALLLSCSSRLWKFSNRNICLWLLLARCIWQQLRCPIHHEGICKFFRKGFNPSFMR